MEFLKSIAYAPRFICTGDPPRLMLSDYAKKQAKTLGHRRNYYEDLSLPYAVPRRELYWINGTLDFDKDFKANTEEEEYLANTAHSGVSVSVSYRNQNNRTFNGDVANAAAFINQHKDAVLAKELEYLKTCIAKTIAEDTSYDRREKTYKDNACGLLLGDTSLIGLTASESANKNSVYSGNAVFSAYTVNTIHIIALPNTQVGCRVRLTLPLEVEYRINTSSQSPFTLNIPNIKLRVYPIGGEWDNIVPTHLDITQYSEYEEAEIDTAKELTLPAGRQRSTIVTEQRTCSIEATVPLSRKIVVMTSADSIEGIQRQLANKELELSYYYAPSLYGELKERRIQASILFRCLALSDDKNFVYAQPLPPAAS